MLQAAGSPAPVSAMARTVTLLQCFARPAATRSATAAYGRISDPAASITATRGAQMTLTPADIHNAEFGKAPFGRRGYNEDEVDTLLDEVTQEMITLLEENNALRSRIDAAGPLDGPNRPDRADAARLSELTADLDRAQRACEHAEHNARLTRRQLDEARQAAHTTDTLRGEAPVEPVLRMAQRTADGYLHEAHERSRVLLAEAHERADHTLREARNSVDAIDRKSQRLQSEAAAELAVRRAGIARDVGKLAQFVVHYRAGLEQHLRHQGKLIDGTGSTADPAGS
jgi:DivIVA domain-containing protein